MKAQPAPDDEIPTALWRAVETADQALSAGKRDGRNRVVTAAGPTAHRDRTSPTSDVTALLRRPT